MGKISFSLHVQYRRLTLKIRVFWYVLNSLIQDDEETQVKGLVYLMYNVVGTNEVNEEVRRLIWRGAHVAQSIPMKVRAVHFCFNDTPLRGLASLFLFAAGKEFRARCRLHSGKRYYFTD